MNREECHLTIVRFFQRVGLNILDTEGKGQTIKIRDLSQEEVDNFAPEDFMYGFEFEDTIAGGKVYFARYALHTSPNDWLLETPNWVFGCWYYKDIPQTRDSPPDVDVVEGPESGALYPVVLGIFNQLMERRLEYAHMAFGEEDET